MADLRPFRALRPRSDRAEQVAAPPYDVVDTAEARALAEGKPDSFLLVNRPEIALPDGTPADSEAVHTAGRKALASLAARGVLVADDAPSYAVYRLTRGGAGQTGIVAAAAVADYTTGIIRTHEQTRPDKEDDRVHHIEGIGAHDEPVFLLVAPGEATWTDVAALIADTVAATSPDLDVTTHDLTTGEPVRHEVWHVGDPGVVAALRAALEAVPVTYVADGHHRSAAAARVAVSCAGRQGADEFPVVVFPGEELTILPYNRVVADLSGRTPAEFRSALTTAGYAVQELSADEDPSPRVAGEVGLRLDDGWWRLVAPTPSGDVIADPVARLDVSVLQCRVLEPLLGIADVRRDSRIGFVGGIRGVGELDRLVDAARWAAAFLMYPTSVDDLVAVASSGADMPPKSTWFEPKLASGLFVHPLGD